MNLFDDDLLLKIDATADALEHSHKGSFSLNGPEQLNLGEIIQILQKATGNEGSISGTPILPYIRDLYNDLMTGTTAHKNAELMQNFYESNLDASAKHAANPFPHVTAGTKLSDWADFHAEDYAHPTSKEYNSYCLN